MTTVGKLKELLADMPDDLIVVGHDGNQERIDYKDVSFYVADRTRDPRFKRNSSDFVRLRQWWGGQIPIKVLVCDML